MVVAGGGKKVAVVTSGMVLPARIRPVRRKTRRVGSGRFRAHRQFIGRLRRRLRRQDVGAASMVKLSRQRRRNVASAKVNVIPRAKKRPGIAKIFAGVASTVTSFRSTPRNAKNGAVSVIHPEKKRSGIADNYVGAASTARSSKFQRLIAGKEMVNVLVPEKKR